MEHFTLQRVIAATDFSAPARHAAERGALLARETGAALNLLHIVAAGPMERLRRLAESLPPELEKRLLDDAREGLRQLADHLARHRGVMARPHTAYGALLPSLLAQAEGMAADLLVLGARGASYMRRLLLGSTAERLLRKSVRPMLVVKQQPHEAYRRVLVAVDFSASSLPALRAARAVAPGAKFVLLHAFEVPFEGKLQFAGVDDATIARYRVAAEREATARLQDLVQDAGFQADAVTRLVLQGDASRHIVEQEQECDCDLIVVGKHGESAVEELLLGSVTKRILAESQGDVLVSAKTDPGSDTVESAGSMESSQGTSGRSA